MSPDEYRRGLFDRLDALRSTLARVRTLAEQGSAADRAALEATLDDLTRTCSGSRLARSCPRDKTPHRP